MSEDTKEDGTQQFVYILTHDGQPPNSDNMASQIVLSHDDSNTAEYKEEEDFEGLGDTLWSKCNHALRDLLVFLVQKHRIEEVMDSKVKSQLWEKLIADFNAFTNGQVMISKPQIKRKWHNWKQYNKQSKKSHPFDVVGVVTEALVREKCQKLLEHINQELDESVLFNIDEKSAVITQPEARISDEPPTSFKAPLKQLAKLRRKDFLVRRTESSASALSIKRLEHEITLECLNYEREKWRICADNQQLIKDKLHKKIALTDVNLEKAQLELILLKQECESKGLRL